MPTGVELAIVAAMGLAINVRRNQASGKRPTAPNISSSGQS